MAKKKTTPVMKNPEAAEQEMIALAFNQAKAQMLNGTAPASVICHFLKLATAKEHKELAKLEADITLQQAKANKIAEAESEESSHNKVIDALKSYRGQTD